MNILNVAESGTALIGASVPVGSGYEPIWLDNLRCSGTEATLFDCPNVVVGETNCLHNKDVGVSCT